MNDGQKKQEEAEEEEELNENWNIIIVVRLLNLGYFIILQERALHYVNDVNGDIHIGEGITLVQTEQPATGGRQLSDVELSENVEARESQVDSMLADRVARFLGTHTLQFKVPKDSIEEMQRSLEEGKSKPINSSFIFNRYRFKTKKRRNQKTSKPLRCRRCLRAPFSAPAL